MPLSRKIAMCLLRGKATSADVIMLLTKYNLLTLLPFIKRSLLQMSSGLHTDETIMIESPYPLSDNSIKHIKTIVGDQKAPHKIIINKNVLAGFKAKYKGMMYDGSAERIIRQLTN